MALDEALSRLAKIDARACRNIELRFSTGLSERETAQALDIALSTLKRDCFLPRRGFSIGSALPTPNPGELFRGGFPPVRTGGNAAMRMHMSGWRRLSQRSGAVSSWGTAATYFAIPNAPLYQEKLDKTSAELNGRIVIGHRTR